MLSMSLYCVSCSNGIVGVFSSLDKIKELLFEIYPSVFFVIQEFDRKNMESASAWIVLYKNTEYIAYASDDKLAAINAITLLNKLGKTYEDDIEYWEQDLDTIASPIKYILDSIGNVSGVDFNSVDNIICYSSKK